MRLFFAINFPADIKNQISKDVAFLQSEFPDFKWVKKQSLHLTLKFIGETTQQKQIEICDRLQDKTTEIDSFEIHNNKAGFFPNKYRPRVFFIGLNHPPQLTSITELLEQSLEPIGIEREKRKFTPHLTLARIKNFNPEHSQLTELENFTLTKFSLSVKEIVLMQSNLTPKGAWYTPVQKFSLRTT